MKGQNLYIAMEIYKRRNVFSFKPFEATLAKFKTYSRKS